MNAEIKAKYEQVQKEVIKLFKKHGFEKIKSSLVLDLPDAYVIYWISRLRKSDDVDRILFQIKGHVRFKLLEQVFREDSIGEFNSSESDGYLGNCFGSSNTDNPQYWGVTGKTDISSLVNDIREEMDEGMEWVKQQASQADRVRLYVSLINTQSSKDWHIRGLMEAIVWTKLLDMEEDCSKAMALLEEHKDKNHFVAVYHLKRLNTLLNSAQ